MIMYYFLYTTQEPIEGRLNILYVDNILTKMQLLLQCYIQCGGIGQFEWNKCKCNAPRVCYQEIQPRILTLWRRLVRFRLLLITQASLKSLKCDLAQL